TNSRRVGLNASFSLFKNSTRETEWQISVRKDGRQCLMRSFKGAREGNVHWLRAGRMLRRAGSTVLLAPADPDLSRPRILRVAPSAASCSSCPSRCRRLGYLCQNSSLKSESRKRQHAPRHLCVRRKCPPRNIIPGKRDRLTFPCHVS